MDQKEVEHKLVPIPFGVQVFATIVKYSEG